ncbi:MAG TPA: DUF2752 domain-containing protein [Holophagaceae bacterium]|jgi:hypothetical protein|nr:DUF2752 domain-containing protein [Holophagaceae bacterium]
MDSPSSVKQAPHFAVQILGLIGLGIVGFSFALGPSFWQGLPEMCAFQAMTGLPCPTCGITRSFAATAHGQLGLAFHYHAFGPFAFVAVLLASLWSFTGRTFPRVRAWMVWAVVAVVFVYGVARMIGWIPKP